MSKPTNFDIPQSLEVIWEALHEYQDECLDINCAMTDDEAAPIIAESEQRWDDICTAMAWLTESLGLEISTADDDTNGEYVQV